MTSASERLSPTPRDPASHWAEALPFLSSVADGLECGLLLIDDRDRIVVASAPLAAIFGLPSEAITAMSPRRFVEHVVGLVDEPPELLKQRRLYPEGNQILCEEFELARPARSVVRWVARRIAQPRPATMVVCSDITAEVDLTNAYEKLAITDRLTGLANRRGAEIALKREHTRSRRHGVALSLVLFDIDHFKVLNDVHGHAFGDVVLRRIGRAVSALPRESDLAARWGGEEFLLILPSTSRDGALFCADRIRAKVEALPFPKGGPVTVSGGVAQMEAGEDVSSVLRRADEALYAAKKAGRNRVL